MHLLEIIDDLYGVARRIRASGFYRVYFNRIKRRYEVHDPHGLAVVIPFSELDDRAYVHVLSTRKEHFDEILASLGQ